MYGTVMVMGPDGIGYGLSGGSITEQDVAELIGRALLGEGLPLDGGDVQSGSGAVEGDGDNGCVCAFLDDEPYPDAEGEDDDCDCAPTADDLRLAIIAKAIEVVNLVDMPSGSLPSGYSQLVDLDKAFDLYIRLAAAERTNAALDSMAKP